MPEMRIQGVKLEVLNTKWLVLYRLMLSGCIVLFSVGLAGLYVLLDLEQETWMGNSKFAVLYWKMAQMFPYATAALVNGGMLGIIMCGLKLYGHHVTLKTERQAATGGDAKKTR